MRSRPWDKNSENRCFVYVLSYVLLFCFRFVKEEMASSQNANHSCLGSGSNQLCEAVSTLMLFAQAGTLEVPCTRYS